MARKRKATDGHERSCCYALLNAPFEVYRGQLMGGIRDGEPVIAIKNAASLPGCPKFRATMTFSAAKEFVELLVMAMEDIYEQNPQLLSEEDVQCEEDSQDDDRYSE